MRKAKKLCGLALASEVPVGVTENGTAAGIQVVAPASGETAYSVCARSHLFSGGVDSRETSRCLLGHPRGAAHHDIPFGLQLLAQRSSDAINASEESLRERTILAAYLPFMSATERRRVVLACASSDGGPLSTVRAHFSWQISRAHELRFCPACAQADWHRQGFSFWRTRQQLPGAWVCPRHRLALHFVPFRPKRLEWLTVEDAAGSAKPLSLPPAQLHLVEKITQCIIWIADLPRADPEVLTAMVRLRMHQDGMLRSELKGSEGEFSLVANRLFHPLTQAGVPGFEGAASATWIAETLIDRRSTHPLRWAMLLAAAGDPTPGGLNASLLEASTRLPAPALFSAPSRRRTRAPDNVYAALDGPVTLSEAAKALAVPVGELERWLRRDPQLGRHWKERAREIKVGGAKFAIQGYLREHPDATRMQVINNCRWAVRLLERSEPDFLRLTLPQGRTTRIRQLSLFS